MEVSVRLQKIPRCLRNVVTGNDLDIAVESEAGIVCAVAARTQPLSALERGVQKCVVASQCDPAVSPAQADFRALATRLSIVHKVSETDLLRRDEQNIVGVLSPKPTRVPI